ncbi:zinc finger MYND domain-containing protein 15-like isoform X2 [Pecten maximus]|uniref:zinc finger MYND domain-containing protein 15-like isoform X2 n=1 Tax=Pecten maximus TaxID=6579 RepID=UPI001458E00B|nr:zinc finger MYND domain-containing protein 15-like isoform X2 [Pecten maximus]
MSFDSCLLDLLRVETDPNYESSLEHLREMRPELYIRKSPYISDNEDFERKYAVALYFLMNSCKNCDRIRFIKQPGDPGFTEGVKAITKKCQLAKERQLQICQLPIEDTVWTLDRIVDQTDTQTTILVIQDRCSLVVGFTAWDTSDKTLSDHIHLALCKACLFPVVHKPRRPRYFGIRDKDLAKSCVLDGGRLGITCVMEPNLLATCQISSQSVQASKDTFQLFRECTVCRFRAEREMFNTCTGCGAMLYCTETCYEIDQSQERQTTLYGHSNWCHKLRTYMVEEEQLVDLPFTFTTETTHPEFGALQLESFLQRMGLLGQGMWQWVSPVTCGPPITRSHGSGFFKTYQNPLGFVKEDAGSIKGLTRNDKTCSLDPGTKLDRSEDPGLQDEEYKNTSTHLDQKTSTPVTDWASYYRYRGLSFDSPVAVLLQWPLTLYYILTSCLSQDYGCKLAEDRPVILDILGVEQEVDLYPVFQELGYLLPGHDFVINMFGKNISKAVDRCVKVIGRVKVKVYRRLYHNYTCRWKPDLVVGFNAGIAAYPSWRDTIQKLKDEQTPAYFTDYCHYSADLGREVMRQGCGLETSTPSVNPFRSPIRRICEQHLLPWFSNAFLFHIIYSPIKQC